MTKTEIAWLAGIIEGEGYIGIHRTSARAGRPGYVYETACIEIAMNDKDIVKRIARIFNKNLLGPYQYGKLARAPHYQAQVFGKDAVKFLRLVLPWLGIRRAKAARRAISIVEKKWNSSLAQ